MDSPQRFIEPVQTLSSKAEGLPEDIRTEMLDFLAAARASGLVITHEQQDEFVVALRALHLQRVSSEAPVRTLRGTFFQEFDRLLRRADGARQQREADAEAQAG